LKKIPGIYWINTIFPIQADKRAEQPIYRLAVRISN